MYNVDQWKIMKTLAVTLPKRETVKIGEIKGKCFKSAPNDRVVRNAIRKPVREGHIEIVGRGDYRLTAKGASFFQKAEKEGFKPSAVREMTKSDKPKAKAKVAKSDKPKAKAKVAKSDKPKAKAAKAKVAKSDKPKAKAKVAKPTKTVKPKKAAKSKESKKAAAEDRSNGNGKAEKTAAPEKSSGPKIPRPKKIEASEAPVQTSEAPAQLTF